MKLSDRLYANKHLLSIFGVLVILTVFFSLFSDSFFSLTNFSNLFEQLAPNLIVAVIMTFIITTAGIDLSVGSILALASALTAIFFDNGFNSFTVLLLVLLVGAIIGSINGYVIAYQKIPPFIVTLASMIYVQGIALFVTGGYSIAIDTDHSLMALGRGDIWGVPISALVALVITVVGAIIFKQTKYGNYLTGIGANEEAVRRSGINVKRVKLVTYLLSGLLASLAGLIVALRLGSGSSNIGTAFELDVIAAVILGGTSLFGGYGTMVGTLLGVTLIGIINNGLTLMHVSPFAIQIVEGVVLLIAVILNIRFFGSSHK